MKENNFIKYANSFQAIARLELASITLLLDFLNHPEKDLEFIHVAGTNGKGSVCAFLAEIFKAEGLKVGKYISPNMVSVCERISINGEDINEADLERILNKVSIASKKVEKTSGDHPTQFEIWTASAFCYFKEQNCDLVILETGLGGTQDATNVIPPPKASVITRIAIDHTSYLGDTISEIASQKAGIIKKRKDDIGVTFSAPQNPEALEVLNTYAKEKNNQFILADTSVIHSPDGVFEVIDYKDYKNLKIGIPGYHQIENATLALEVASYFGVAEESIKKGLENAKNIGRFEILKNEPVLIFDGAHNPNGMKSLVNNLKRYFAGKKVNFIIGFMADKDILNAINEILKEFPLAETFCVTVKDNPRAIKAEELAKLLNNAGLLATPCSDIKTACNSAFEKGDVSVICGSLYLYKDFVESSV